MYFIKEKNPIYLINEVVLDYTQGFLPVELRFLKDLNDLPGKRLRVKGSVMSVPSFWFWGRDDSPHFLLTWKDFLVCEVWFEQSLLHRTRTLLDTLS